MRYIRWLLGKYPMPVYTVLWNISTDVGPRSNMAWLPTSDLGHIQEWAGFGIALAKMQEIARELFRYNNEVCLKVIRRQAASWTSQQAQSCLGSNFHSAKRAGVHF